MMNREPQESARRLKYWMRVLLLLALAAGVLAVSGLAGTFTTVSYIVFLVFMVCYGVAFLRWRKLPPIP